jgi:hypothetical protein
VRTLVVPAPIGDARRAMDDADVTLIMETLFDIRAGVVRVLRIPEGDDGEEEEEEADE